MKLRHPLFIRSASFALSWGLRAWIGSLNYRVICDEPGILPDNHDRRRIYLFWHDMILMPVCAYSREGVTILSSRHADGELISQTWRFLGGHVVRGSLNKRGFLALRKLIRRGRLNHLGLTPDGPKGPRRVVKPGVVFLASRTGMPIVPTGMAFSNFRRAKSWDQMALPIPFTAGAAVLGRSMEIPKGLDRDGIEAYRQQVQLAFDEVQSRAEAMAKRL